MCNTLHVDIRDAEPVKRAMDGMLDRIDRLEADNASLRSICAQAAAALSLLEFREDEERDRALTERLIDSLARASGGWEVVRELLPDES